MKSGWAVIAVLLILGVAGGMRLASILRRELPQAQDLVTGLVYFIETNEGRFPASEAEFLASGILEARPDGAFAVRPPAQTSYRQPYGVPLPPLRDFHVAWGTDLTQLSFDERGKVIDAQGRTVEMLHWAASPPAGKEYAKLFLKVSQAERARAAASSRPAAP